MNFRYNTLYMLTGLVILGLALFNHWVLAFHEIPTENRELYFHATGMLDGAFISGLVATFFGSSKKDHEGVTTTTQTLEIKETPSETKKEEPLQ